MEIGWWVEIVTHHNRFLTLEWVFDTEPVSQSLFFFSGRIIMRLTIVLDSCFLHIICFLLCFFSVIIFLFFATHCMWFLRLMLLCFFLAKKCNQIHRMGMEHMFHVRIYVLFQIIESAGDQRDTNCEVKCSWMLISVLARKKEKQISQIFRSSRMSSFHMLRPMDAISCWRFVGLHYTKRVEFSDFSVKNSIFGHNSPTGISIEISWTIYCGHFSLQTSYFLNFDTQRTCEFLSLLPLLVLTKYAQWEKETHKNDRS